MKTVTFPDSESLSIKPIYFSIESVVLVALNKFVGQLLLRCFLGLSSKNSMEEVFRYNFSSFEVGSLSSLDEQVLKDILCDYYYCVPYDFYLDSLKTRFTGVLDISLKFINKSVFEKSYFEISFKIDSGSDFENVFSSISGRNFYEIFFEFQNSMWSSVFATIKRREINDRPLLERDSDYAFIAPMISQYKDIFLPSNNISVNSSLPDTYNIVSDLFLSFKGEKNYIFISPDDILSHRNIKKNPNSKGYRGGYKDEQRKRIREDIKVLSSCGAIYTIDISDDLYCVSLDSGGRNIYNVPKKIIEYSQRIEICEKFIGEFLYFESYSKNKNNITINVIDLIKIVLQSLKTNRLSVLRDRVEKALDRLQEDNIIQSWVYSSIEESAIKHITDYEKLKILVVL